MLVILLLDLLVWLGLLLVYVFSFDLIAASAASVLGFVVCFVFDGGILFWVLFVVVCANTLVAFEFFVVLMLYFGLLALL